MTDTKIVLYTLDNIHFDYGQGFGLTDINLRLCQSDVIAITGPNGSGKTTLLNLLAFILKPTKGTLYYQGHIINGGNREHYKKTIGYVQQNPYLLCGNGRKNIALGLKLRHTGKVKRLQKVAEIVELLKIQGLVDRNVRTLSGGEAQKIAIARALILKPEVIILDEPFTYLDKETIGEFEKLILNLRDTLKKTIIFTTHCQYQAQRLANRRYSMMKGNLFQSQLLNLFKGRFNRQGYFATGHHQIIMPEDVTQAELIAIDPKQIVISRKKPGSSMCNNLSGRINAIIEQDTQLRLHIDTGDEFQVIISREVLIGLKLNIGDAVWISFKSSSITVV